MTLAGAIACRLEMNAASDGARLYIMTLGVYAGRTGREDWVEALDARAERGVSRRVREGGVLARADE